MELACFFVFILFVFIIPFTCRVLAMLSVLLFTPWVCPFCLTPSCVVAGGFWHAHQMGHFSVWYYSLISVWSVEVARGVLVLCFLYTDAAEMLCITWTLFWLCFRFGLENFSKVALYLILKNHIQMGQFMSSFENVTVKGFNLIQHQFLK